MTIDEQRLALERQIRACNVKLDLLPPFGREQRDEEFRAELERKRDQATAALIALQGFDADASTR